MQLMEQESQLKISLLKVDGGASANNFLMQFQADLLGITIERPENIESTVLGATILAAIGQEIWQAEHLPKVLHGKSEIFQDKISAENAVILVSAWQNAIKKCLA